CNKTPWEFYVVTKPEKLEELRLTTMFTRKMKAPLAIVVAADLGRSLPPQLGEFWPQDCSAATENILLRVTDLGLGAVWCGIHPKEDAVKKVSRTLELPKKQVPLNIIFIGHPDEAPEARDQYEPKYIHYIR
ncbi:MAG: nitroreductase family protein, partial [Lachnospiraceae bacterium]|nr:nitroreductase family protein [Lachnospiraceae bacterium]